MKVKNILHIGGYVGEETKDYEAMGVDFTFVEPVPEYAEAIRKSGAKVIEVAVGKQGKITFYQRQYASSYLRHKKSIGKEIKVKAVPLSEIQEGFDMLVIDAQGATLDILKSGDIGKFNAVVCEASRRSRYEGEAPLNDIVEYMDSNDFSLLYPFKHVGHDIYDLVFISRFSS